MALNRLRETYVNAVVDETTFGTAVTTSISKIAFDNAAIISPDVQAVDDSDHITGDEEATDQEIIAQTLSFPFGQTRVKPHTLIWAAGYGFGAGSITSTQLGVTSAYRHAILPSSTQALPSFTADATYEDTPTEKQFTGGLMNDFTLEVTNGANRFVNLTGNVLFRGNINTSSNPSTAGPTEGGLNAASASVNMVTHATNTWDAVVDDSLDVTQVDLQGSPVDLTDSTYNLKGLTWNFSNNINVDNNFTIGSGNVLGSSKRTGRTQTLNLTFDVANSNALDDLIAGTNSALQFKLRNTVIDAGPPIYAYGMNLIFPKLRYESVTVGEQNGDVVYNATFKVLEHATHGSVRLYVYNTQTTYFS